MQTISTRTGAQLTSESLRCARRAQIAREVSPRRRRAAKRIARECADFVVLRRTTPLLEVSPRKLSARVGKRLTATELMIYGLVRRAVQLGRAGVLCSAAELGELVDRCRRQVQRALHSLERLGLLVRVPQWHDVRPDSDDPVDQRLARMGHPLRQGRNAWRLGELARKVSPRRIWRRVADAVSAARGAVKNVTPNTPPSVEWGRESGRGGGRGLDTAEREKNEPRPHELRSAAGTGGEHPPSPPHTSSAEHPPSSPAEVALVASEKQGLCRPGDGAAMLAALRGAL